MPSHAPYIRARQLTFAIFAAAFAARLASAVIVPLTPDETYYWEWSRHLAAGYLDHPPAIALAIRLGTTLIGATPLGVRLVSVLAGAAASLTIALLARTLGGDRAMLRAAAIIACMPLAQLGLALATPDSLLLFFWALALAALVSILPRGEHETPSKRALSPWLLLGLSVGAALETKYTAILLALGVAIALAAHHSLRPLLATAGPCAALFAALIAFAPNIAWNVHHNFVSFAYQLEHGLVQHRGTALQHELRMLGGQLGLVSPLLLLALGAAVTRALRARVDPLRSTLAVISATAFLFFVCTALRSAVEPSWQAPAYLSAIVLAATIEGTPAWHRALRAAIALGALVTALIYAHAIHPFVPANPSLDATASGFGWAELAAHVDSARHSTPAGITTWMGGERYQEASELAYHLPDHPATVVIDVRARRTQYDLWPTFAERAHRGDRLVLVLGTFAATEIDPVVLALAPQFEHVALREVVPLRRGVVARGSRRIWILDGWRGGWPSAALSP